MSGIVHFKFKSSNSYDSVSFDGAFVSVGELKVLIAEKKGLSKDATSELLLSEPRTQTEYNDDSAVIPKSSSVLVRRVPNLQTPLQKAVAPQQAATAAQAPLAEVPPAGTSAADDEFGGDLYSEQRDEDEALTNLLAQTGQQWEKQVKEGASRGRGRGFRARGGFGGRGRGSDAPPAVLPKGYICFRCGQTGHHISDCPSSADPDAKRIRPAVGVPTALLTKSTGGGLLLPDGTTGSLQPNEDAFLKEIGGMPKAAAEQAPASEAQPAVSAAEAASKAIVPVSDGEPALAGSSELGMPFGPSGGLLLPPEGGTLPWGGEGVPPLPQLPLPGKALPNMPLSREEFQRMQEQLRRKHERSSKRSMSRSPGRRRRPRDSPSPRPRRHKSRRRRDRSSSEERRPRRLSVTPSFIQLRKRSNSPKSRKRRPSRSRSPAAHSRRKDSRSPQKNRSRRREATRWNAEGAALLEGQAKAPAQYEEFQAGEGFESVPQAAERAQLASTSGRDEKLASADFSVPELMDEPNPLFFGAPDENGVQGLGRSQRGKAGAGGQLSRLQRGVGSRWRTEETDEGAEKAKMQGGLEQGTDRDPRGESLGARRDPSSPGSRAAAPTAPEGKAAEQAKSVALPKTFSIPLESAPDKKDKKLKRSKEKKEKEKRKRKLSPTRGEVASDAAGLDLPQQTGLEVVGNYVSSAPETEHTSSSRPLATSPGSSKRLKSDSMTEGKSVSTSEPDDPLKRRGRGDALFAKALGEATWEKSPEKKAAYRQLDEAAAANGRQEAGKSVEQGSPEKAGKSHKHKHKHKHSKRRHKDD